MTEWQAIETAPKDGTHVKLKYSVNFGTQECVLIGWWGGDEFEGWMTEYGCVVPTDWMPLPEPPRNTKG